MIAMSLWGEDPRYLDGAEANVRLAKTIYPGWTVVIYASNSVPEYCLVSLSAHRNCEVVRVDDSDGPLGLMWRFRAVTRPGAKVVLFRDADSRLSARERAAVDEWLAGDSDVHVMRDHEFHSMPILGGMWGIRGTVMERVSAELSRWQAPNRWFVDTDFLEERVYRNSDISLMVHQDRPYFDDYRIVEVASFPLQPDWQGDFVGRGIEADGSPRWDHGTE